MEDDLLGAFREKASLADYPVKNDLWVFVGCECDFSHSGIKPLVSFIRTHYPLKATRAKTAMLTADYLHNAMGVMFSSEAERLPYPIRIFQDFSEATAWLL
ncbi:MAG: hypothetical protein HGB00_07470 [Chlorobiaceae bacterium]|nr:hypothetical protein [Chlorobiaceae bacterium]